MSESPTSPRRASASLSIDAASPAAGATCSTPEKPILPSVEVASEGAPALLTPTLFDQISLACENQKTPPTPKGWDRPRPPLSPKTFVPPAPNELPPSLWLVNQKTPPTPTYEDRPRKHLSPKTFEPPTPEELGAGVRA